nr:MAG: hypothetical protein EDM05_31610 [Leptolyngbya sp. IPPAS B-1204]
MRLFRLLAALFTGLTVLGLSSCASQPQSAAESPSVTAENSPTPAAAPTPEATSAKDHSHGGQGGQVIETGDYHLELLAKPEANGTHLDFFLQKGDDHEPIPDAKVVVQVQLPNGTQQKLDLTYDASGEHYTVFLPATATGEYKLVVLSDINGEKVNGRYTFMK